VLFVATAAGVLIFIALVVWLFSRSGRNAAPDPALATAQVSAPQSAILKDPSDSDVIVTLKKGDSVNVIRPPRSRSQEWTEVQYVAGPKVSPPGVIHTADLGGWSSTKPDIALGLVQIYAPGPDASEAQMRQYAASLSEFITKFSGTPQQADARAELDRINAALGRTAAPPASSRTRPLSNATPAAPRREAVLDVDAELKRAEQAWERGDYGLAERVLKRILQQKPELSSARIMLERVEKAKLLEGGR
jgi:hypothetical protein